MRTETERLGVSANIITLPDNGHPWVISMKDGDLICTNPEHDTVVIEKDRLEEIRWSLIVGRK